MRLFLSSSGTARHHPLPARPALERAGFWWSLSAASLVLALAIAVLIPQVSVLTELDGAKRLYGNRQFDLPTGDERGLSDYELIPFSMLLGVSAAFCFAIGLCLWDCPPINPEEE